MNMGGLGGTVRAPNRHLLAVGPHPDQLALAGYAEAVHQALSDVLQVNDRWHIWHNFAQAAGKEVAVHSGCWASASRLQRWHQIQDLLDVGVGLLECARRLTA